MPEKRLLTGMIGEPAPGPRLRQVQPGPAGRGVQNAGLRAVISCRVASLRSSGLDRAMAFQPVNESGRATAAADLSARNRYAPC